MFPRSPALRTPLDDLVGYQLRRASLFLMGELARDLGQLGLKPGEASVLLLVEANPGATQTRIGRELAIKRANMAPVAAKLDRLGLIRRVPVDGRSHGLLVTDPGRELALGVRGIMMAHDRRILAALPAEMRDGLASGLAALWR